MTWQTISNITISQDWQLTPIIAASLGYVRLSFSSAGIPVFVAQIDPSTGDIADQRRLVGTVQNQVLRFDFPSTFQTRALALRIPVFSSSFQVKVEVSSIPVETAAVNFQPVLDAIESVDIDLSPVENQITDVNTVLGGVANTQEQHTTRLTNLSNSLQTLANSQSYSFSQVLGSQNDQRVQISGITQAIMGIEPPDLQPVLDGQSQILQAIDSIEVPEVNLQPVLSGQTQILQAIETIDVAAVDLQPVLNGQAQILTELQSLDVSIDPNIAANIQSIAVKQIAQDGQLNKIDAVQNAIDQQAAEIDKISTTQGTQGNQLTSLTSGQATILQQIQSNQAQLIQIISAIPSNSQPAQPVGVQLNYSAFGDQNGLFYYLGSNRGAQQWINPLSVGLLQITVFSPSVGSVAALIDRTVTAAWYTNNAPNQFVVFDLGANRRFAPNAYTIQHTSETGFYLRSWRFQGSNDNAIWTDLDVRRNDTTINAIRAWGRFNAVSPSSYRYLRILMTGTDSSNSNYLAIGEIEFYGTLFS